MLLAILRNRWLGCSAVVAGLILLGVGVYRLTPPEPMCVIDSSDRPLFFVENRFLATLANPCRERFRLDGWDTRYALLSNDGRTLVTDHDTGNNRRLLRCWDVDAWKPLRWAIGVPTGLGALLVLRAFWRGRARRRVPMK